MAGNGVEVRYANHLEHYHVRAVAVKDSIRNLNHEGSSQLLCAGSVHSPSIKRKMDAGKRTQTDASAICVVVLDLVV